MQHLEDAKELNEAPLGHDVTFQISHISQNLFGTEERKKERKKSM
jgi:hypothetical protein